MTSFSASNNNNINNGCFTSFVALRAAHTQLLKQYRNCSNRQELISQVKEFIQQGRVTGSLLSDEEDRCDAQSYLDYWATILYDNGHESPNTTLEEFNPISKLPNILTVDSTEAELEFSRKTLVEGIEQNAVQLGKYNINIGQAHNFQIGDTIDSETLRQELLKVVGDIKSRTLLTSREFSERLKNLALGSYEFTLVGREPVLEEIKQRLSQDIRVIILHGSAGLGKTRLLLELPHIISEDKSLWYVRNEAESIETELASLDKNQQHIIVLDDAHRCSFLYQLREVLANPQIAGKVTLILATRTVFKDSIIYQLDFPAKQVSTIEITSLKNSDIDQILQNTPYNLSSQDLRFEIIKIAEGNPLIAAIATRLTQQRVSLAHLSRDEILSSYLDNVIRDLSQIEEDEPRFYQLYLRYLEILAALGTVNLEEKELRAKIQEILGLTSSDEERIIARLVGVGLIEKYWKLIKISYEFLADYIIIQHFFNPNTKCADYQQQIIEPFFNLKPKEILTNLAEAEFKSEFLEARTLLQRKLYELRRSINQQGNFFRLQLFDSLRDVAYFKPDDIIYMVASVVDAPEFPQETIQDQLWGTFQITHEMVLNSAIELLKRTIYLGGLRDSINYLHKLALYRIEESEYGRVRAAATKSLIEIAEFKLHYSYETQFIIIDFIAEWLKQDFTTNLPLSLALIQCMLKIQLYSAETHPTQSSTIVIHQGDLEIVEPLKQIRERSLNILYAAYQQATNLANRLQIVQTLNGATPYLRYREQVSAQTLEQLQYDCKRTAGFFSEVVSSNAELPILDKISEWLHQAKNFHKYQGEELDHLQQQLNNHRGYQLYRLLIGSYRWDEEGKRLDWETVEQQKKQKINEYLEGIYITNRNQIIEELEAIASQAFIAGENNTFGLTDLLILLGQKYVDLSQYFVTQVLDQGLTLKQYLGFILTGIRLSNQEIARSYVRSWIEQEDLELWIAIAISYKFIDWSQAQLEEEPNILRQLVAKQSPLLDSKLLFPIRNLVTYQTKFAIELLKIVASRGDEQILRQVAEVISWQVRSNQWTINFDNLEDLIEIINNFERLSYLDYSTEECLNCIISIAPMGVIDLIENRIKSKKNKYSTDKFYQAFPKPFSRAFDNIKSNPQYLDILHRVINWMLQDDFLLRLETPALLEGLALNLEGTLYNILMEWIDSKDVAKIEAVAKILREFNSGQNFYNLSREIILRTQDENILSSIHAAIFTTPGVIVGSMSNFYKQRIEEITPWLSDENIYVRNFAQKVNSSLQLDIEREEEMDRLRKRNW